MSRKYTMYWAFVFWAYMDVCIALVGCSKPANNAQQVETTVTQKSEQKNLSPRNVSLTWDNFDGEKLSDPQAAVYALGGKPMGKGDKGFTNVLNAVDALPRGSWLWISHKDIFPLDMTKESNYRPLIQVHNVSDGVETVPFYHSRTLVQEIKKLAKERNLALAYLIETKEMREGRPKRGQETETEGGRKERDGERKGKKR